MKIFRKEKRNSLFNNCLKIILPLFYFLVFQLGIMNGQNSTVPQITMEIKNEKLDQLLKELESKSGYQFRYSDEILSDKRQFSYRFVNESLNVLLNQISADAGLDYIINGTTITLKKLELKKVEGKVTNASGESLPGVSVGVKSTGIGTVTNANGDYSLSIHPGSVLLFSFIGMETYEMKYSGQPRMNVVMRESAFSLEEVVAVGYGTQKKANLTGSVSQITAKVFENRPLTNVNSGLQGTMPGVSITGAFGAPGSNAGSIRIRGIGTWGNATPLVVIDGVPGGNLNILNPEDIESISVLKDAASSSIYGVRGANGVILVTTKIGSESKPTINYTHYFGFQTPTALPDFLGSHDYMTLLNEALVNVGRNPTYTDEEIEVARNGSNPNYYANTDWINEIYKDRAPQSNHSLSVTGGNRDFNYFLSYANLKEGGLITGDNFDANRQNLRAKFTTKLMDRLELTTNLGYVDRTITGAAAGTGPIGAAHSILPLVPVRFTTGTWGYIGGQSNPIAVATDGGTNNFASQEFTANLNAALTITDDLKLRLQYGTVRYNSKRSIFTKTINYYSPEDGSLIYRTGFPNKIDTRDYTGLDQSLILTTEYEKRITIHEIKVLMGASQEETSSDNFTASRTNLASQTVGHINLGTENQLNSGNASQSRLRSAFGRINYGLNNKYLLEGNLRYDGSSRFIKEHRWDLFASASLGWVFTEEKFLVGIRNVLEFGKIRASYGTQGNDRIGDYAFMDILAPITTMPIGNSNTIGYRQSIVANELLLWETAVKKNIGLDLIFMNNRLNVVGDIFINASNDMLLTLPLPDVFGAPYPSQNAGSVENRGWEIQVGWKDQIKEFKYGVNFNLSDVRNEVVNLAGTPPTIGDRVRMVGHPLDAFYGLVADRIAQESDFKYDPETGEFVPDFPYILNDPVAPGDIIYKDLDGDGRITLEEDRKVIGSDIPRYSFGLMANAEWKGLDLSFIIQGVGKVNGYLTGSARHAYINESTMPQTIHLDRWTPENTDASYPRLAFQQTFNQRYSTFWLEDASYLRLKNIQIGYTLPSRFTERFRASRFRVYASADNLLTLSDFFYGYDPESPVGGADFYPQVKTFVMGLNINFK
jgi:TonB-linked SusC/RagA family outer membrane protein